MALRNAAFRIALLGMLLSAAVAVAGDGAKRPVDFNRDVRQILSNNCFQCHGPDAKQRQAGLRLDVPDGIVAELESGSRAVVRGNPDKSELIQRVASTDPELRMPPASTGKKLTAADIELLTRWIREGAPYAKHWSYENPVRPEFPAVANMSWPKNAIDHFILERLEREGLAPAPEADRAALIRRVALDLTGLPPTLEEVDRFLNDSEPQAFEQLVDRLLQKESFGEHWGRMWLDLARYADSAGYADDPPRTIWAYRDWVIRAINANLPFDQFTIEQLAGDLLPNPTDDQLIATAFHRNTLTNNEGGTNDEEFRNVAIVDRVNTTMAVWMGTTAACAQCHAHKYDPISQEDFFRVFAILNNTDDADRKDESPLLSLFTEDQKRHQAEWQREVAELAKTLSTSTPELLQSQQRWEQSLATDVGWHALQPATVQSKEAAPTTLLEDGSVLVGEARETDVVSVDLPLEPVAGVTGLEAGGQVKAIRLETLPHDSLPNQGPGHGGGNFVITRVTASLSPPNAARPTGRFVRIQIPGKAKILSLAEVQVFSGADNIAISGEAKQCSTAYDGPAQFAIDGKTDGIYQNKSTTHTESSDDPWWELDLKSERPIDRLVVWNRADNGVQSRLANFQVAVLNQERQPIWESTVAEPPNPSREFPVSLVRPISLSAAFADYSQSGFDAAGVVLPPSTPPATGWAVGGQIGQPHVLTLQVASPLEVQPGSKLVLSIEQLSPHANHTVGRFRVSATSDARVTEFARTPPAMLQLARTPAANRTDAQRDELTRFFLADIAPELQQQRSRLASLRKQLAELKPGTSVPIFRELAGSQRRTTRVQHRGNFLDLSDEVTAGVPAAFHPLRSDANNVVNRDGASASSPPNPAPPDRLALARWLVDPDNPLTARVTVNRYWEAIFGTGLVRTSEEFGSQGELPSHPLLLDWLATELIRLKWDTKALLKLLVTSATYRQSSRVTPELMERDPDNRLLARGPRLRLSAEMIRDQALFASGLLSPKLYGPPVKPPQPELGVNAAFGSGIDWQSSAGEDRYRRGLYTTWRRSNPYPSMSTFDAPNREVCTIRRDRTNTPLQALVTLNDPVYVEAAQGLARRMAASAATDDEKVRFGFRTCLARHPSSAELQQLMQLYQEAAARFANEPDKARQMATEPLGPALEGTHVGQLAAWTVVANVLLNLDELFLKR